MAESKIRGFKDISGKKFGRLIAVEPVRKSGPCKTKWICICDCGATTEVILSQLTMGRTESCGCLQRERAAGLCLKHGRRRSLEYNSYTNAQQRCGNPKHPDYSCYGGRGIEFRFKSFQEFFAILGPRPTSRHQIDRIDNEGHYEKGNVRWATSKEQNNNKRSNHIVEYNGQQLTLAEAIRQSGCNLGTVKERMRRGWSADRLFSSTKR